MHFLIDFLYILTVLAIRAYKFLELAILKLFSGPLIKELIRRGETLGIVFHMPGEINSEISTENEIEIQKKSGHSSIFHVKINNLAVFPLGVNQAMLGIAEEYMNGGWEIIGTDNDIVEGLTRFFESNLFQLYFHPLNKFLNYLEFQAFNLQTTGRAFQVAEKHYDLGNDLFESFLDPWMQYSCGYWAKADNLNDSQIQKLELIAKKLDLKPGMRVLDVGCGWGTLCKYLAQNYDVDCVGITVSKEGAKFAEENCKGLKTEFRVQDYRELNEKFDRIVSIECLEHLGGHNYRGFFEVAHKCLKDDGIFVVQIFGVNHHNFPLTDSFMHKYVLPNAGFPYFLDVAKSTEGLFIIEDWHNFGLDFAKTFNAWRSNFQGNWGTKMEGKYGDKFFRQFNFYLMVTEALFKSRRLQLWQLVLSKDGLKREYRAAR